MKKLLILGGAEAQVPVIQAAKKEGYYVVLCDWTTTNPGIKYADKHYQVNTLDTDAVIRVAVEENIDGVISNSEPAMLNVSRIAKELHLRGNSIACMETLLSKDRFRSLQEAAGVYAPKHYLAENETDFLNAAEKMPCPFVVKPAASSASRGTTVVSSYDPEGLKALYRINTDYSWNDQCMIEEFVDMPSLTMIEGDLFVLNKEILWDGLFFTTRSRITPMLPMTYSLPLRTDPIQLSEIQSTLVKILDAAGFTFGELNVEMYFTQDNRLFVIELNPRQGGAGIPAFIFHHRLIFRGNRYPDAQDDLRQAIKYVKDHVENNQIGTLKIGVMGFSAGGHLAMSAAELFKDSSKPDFVAAIYPVVTMTDSCVHKRSRRGLLGDSKTRNEELCDLMSLERHVPEKCPPVFLVNCVDDPIVDYRNSVLLDSALTEKNIEHYYAQFKTGGHGFGASEQKGTAESHQWKMLFLEWLEKLLKNNNKSND